MTRKSYEDDLSDPAILQSIAQRLGGYMNRDMGKIRIYGVKWSYDGGRHAYVVAKCKCGINFVLSETAIGAAMAEGCFYCRRMGSR